MDGGEGAAQGDSALTLGPGWILVPLTEKRTTGRGAGLDGKGG